MASDNLEQGHKAPASTPATAPPVDPASAAETPTETAPTPTPAATDEKKSDKPAEARGNAPVADPGGLDALQRGLEGKRRKTTAEIAREQGKVALGLYFPVVDDLELARRAFATDFYEHDGPAAFSEWLSRAILAHAKRTPGQRAELAQPRREKSRGVKGKLRKIDVRPEISAAVEAGRTADREELRRTTSVSAWCYDAVMAAIDDTRNRTAGDLVVIDGPLPSRLRK
ncbi:MULTISPECIES: hypothetical protein [Pimelobacter]|uniref:hypothetical protein n=1 Tax=Pimelobacter TaxID=2044 RepID=UPI001C03DF6A|nr:MULTISPECIES: hypothetical protein [Pimelobacter]MBU2698865.1 hypothetical protein [Pimelobacter sp. 30-1]UUW92997.1 hypothetical protein M0M43_30655 [Pimelobacter simplex]UUW99030.1 hypothetical protein M0M48_30675 [Pimelobacter simplex]